MKRIFHPIIAIMLIVATFPSIASAETSYETIKLVSLKQSASTKAKTIITIPKGKTVTHLSNKGSWSNIQYGKYKGFVAKRDIRKKSSSNNETLPPPIYQYTQYASYKGGTIISIYGKSYQIDAPLLPFFKKNAHVLNTIFGIPILNKNKLIGYKELQFDTFRPNQNGKVVSIHIDPQAAQKIETFVIPAYSSFSPTYKIFATAPVRQIATSRTAAKELYEKTTHIELYGGPFQQVDLTGEVNVAGKATINRLVLRKGDLYPSTHSYTSGIDLSGTITHLESSHSDAQVTIGKTTLIRNVKGVSTSQVLDGQFGLIRGKRPNAAVVQGRWMNEDERKISEWTELLMKSKVSDSDLLAWFEQIDLQDVNKTYLPSYRLALETN
ncbi:hypothetical protein ON063_05240, partial [Exiguobacterium sp. B2(2022)]|nr:hypothetical protein [Exiguobacterium sp. B2(2022)]